MYQTDPDLPINQLTGVLNMSTSGGGGGYSPDVTDIKQDEPDAAGGQGE